jgi:hypothetical protein
MSAAVGSRPNANSNSQLANVDRFACSSRWNGNNWPVTTIAELFTSGIDLGRFNLVVSGMHRRVEVLADCAVD